MEKKLLRLTVLITMVLVLILAFNVKTLAVTTNEKIILKKSKNEFLIYYEDLVNEEFEFAFSKDSETKDTDLKFTKCGKDKAESTSNIAYIDSTFYNKFFSDKKAYIWIKNSSSEIVVKADLIDLSKAIDESIIKTANTTTSRIDIDTSKTSVSQEEIEGVETTITRGKILIVNKDGAKYSYAMYSLKSADNSSKIKKFYEAALTLANSSTTYQKLKNSIEFYDLYTSLMPKNWTNAKKYEILQPDDAEDGDRYVVYIKEKIGDKTTIDAKFLTSTRKEDSGTNQITEEYTETVKLPVTFDSGIILFIALGVIVIALIVFLVIRKKLNKEESK